MRSSVARTAIVVALAATEFMAQEPAVRPPAQPVEPIAAILAAFETHPVVILGHPHGNEQKYQFLLALLRDPRLPLAVDDIVEECGNARYQDLMDRFIAGEDVARDALRRVWEDTISVVPNCDLPMYEEFYRTVRAINRTQPAARRLRVLLGDVPIDWSTVKSFGSVTAWDERRDEHAAALIRQEVLAKGRRALVLFGDLHATRTNERVDFLDTTFLAGLLERDAGTRVFSVWQNLGSGKPELSTIQADVTAWPVPSLAPLRGTRLGAADFSLFLTSDGRFERVDGALKPLPRERWRPMPMERQVDAMLYLGPATGMTFQRLSRERCADEPYMTMRTGRMALMPGAAGAIQRLRQYCEALLAP